MNLYALTPIGVILIHCTFLDKKSTVGYAKKKPARRDFIKLCAGGLGSLAIAPFADAINQASMLTASGNTNDKKLKIVCVGAHPGDPEFGCGGTMAKYSDAGHAVVFLYLTKGEASDPKKTFAAMAAARTAEAEVACRILKATPLFAGQVDGNTVLDNDRNAVMAKLIMVENPDLVFTRWPIDSHADHQVTGLLVLTTWIQSGRKFQLYFYEVNTGSETMAFVPTDYVDIAATHSRKKEAMFAHKTQNPVETYNNYFKPLEAFRGLEAGVKVGESFIHFKPTSAMTSLMGL